MIGLPHLVIAVVAAVGGALGALLVASPDGRRSLRRALLAGSVSSVALIGGFAVILVADLLSGPSFVAGALIWVAATFAISRDRPPGSLLRTGSRTLAILLGVVIGALGTAMVLDGGSAFGRSKAPQKRTMADMRNLGTALMSWAIDHVEWTPSSEGDAGPASGTEPVDDEAESAGASTFHWGRLPPISGADLEALLTNRPDGSPPYIQQIPTLDGYGHPLEVRLEHSAAEHWVAIRSLGADGKPDGDVYEIGPFPASERDRDIVWADGSFVAWPERPRPERRRLEPRRVGPPAREAAEGLVSDDRETAGPVSFPTADGGRVHGRLAGAGSRALLLVHGGRFDQESWSDEIPVFVDAGWRVLAIDLRGRGLTTVPADASPDDLHEDVLGAVRFLKSVGAERIAVVGASLGGWAAARAAIAAGPGAIDDLVLLAAPSIEDAERIGVRTLFLVAQDDVRGDGIRRLDEIREQHAAVPGEAELVVVEGSAHAQFLFDTDQRDRVLREIVDFLGAD